MESWLGAKLALVLTSAKEVAGNSSIVPLLVHKYNQMPVLGTALQEL